MVEEAEVEEVEEVVAMVAMVLGQSRMDSLPLLGLHVWWRPRKTRMRS